jgi:non-specific serine/threonine protein kinase/serine/threonine-protein kinase
MPDRGEHVAALFEAALALDPEQRSAFLDRVCGDSSLRDEVERLLHADAVAGSFLKDPLFELPTADDGHASQMTIGPYTLLEVIGQGGMGEVWLAEQRQPVRRRVAIKLIKVGMDTKEVVGRFESERQALALMDHPAIAKVFDAGSTPEGRPYFVMEYVAGLPITDYCDKHKLTIRQRLELFIRVCDGVQHAHQKAIIHRDLKPSNILVSEADGKPFPRIIDFGVSKAISQTLTARTVYTRIGTLIGTVGYMSPEQANSDGEDIDTRTDVYSLGAVLYELLCGALPLDLRKAVYDEARRRLREEDVPNPSTRIKAAGENSAVAARNRGGDPPAVARQLRGEPDAIALKALEKDRARRYASASELAADIERYLRHEPVVAHAPSAAYRAARYIRQRGFSSARRHTALLFFASGCAIILALMTTWLVRRHSPTAPIRSLAVLPLENLSGDASQEYFADGMTDELTTELARIPGLRVVSRSSVMREKGTRKPLDQIARELNVDAVVEGSVIRLADKVRITARLIDARNEKNLWAQSFEGRAGDILSLQDDVAREIAAQAKVALTPAARAGMSGGKPIDPAAHDAYLRGRYFLDRREAKKSADYFQQAIAIDPTYAAAFAGLADALHSESILGVAPSAEVLPRALAMAKHAIELDPTNSEAYSVSGTIEADADFNWNAAERDLRHAIELNPNDASAEIKYAIYLDVVNRPEKAVEHMRRAIDIDPLSFFVNREMGTALYYARRYDEALVYLRRAGEMDPSLPGVVENWISSIYEKKGMQDEAVGSELKALSQDISQANLDILRSTYQRGGWKTYQKAKIELMTPDADTYCVPYGLALAYLRLGEVDRAFPFLHQAMDQHCWEILQLQVDPLLDSIRSDPRYHELLQKMKLVGSPSDGS